MAYLNHLIQMQFDCFHFCEENSQYRKTFHKAPGGGGMHFSDITTFGGMIIEKFFICRYEDTHNPPAGGFFHAYGKKILKKVECSQIEKLCKKEFSCMLYKKRCLTYDSAQAGVLRFQLYFENHSRTSALGTLKKEKQSCVNDFLKFLSRVRSGVLSFSCH